MKAKQNSLNKHYLLRYLRICQSYKNLNLTKEYTEIHHIIPTCLGGDDSEINLVRLPIKAHILVHEILYKALPKNKKVAYSYRMMCLMKPNENSGRKPTLRQLEKARKVNSSFSNMKGKKHSQSAKEKMREAKLGKPSNRKNKKASFEVRKNISLAMKKLYKSPYNHPRTDMNIYHFIHEDGRTVAGRIVGISILFKEENLDTSKLRKLVRGGGKSHKGWRILQVNTETA